MDYRRGADYLRPASAAAVGLADRYGASIQKYRKDSGADYRKEPEAPSWPGGGRNWSEAVVFRAALGTNASFPPRRSSSFRGVFESLLVIAALGLGTFVSSIGGAGLGAPWSELLMETACERRNITFPSIACNQDDGSQAEAAWRQEWMNLGTTIPQFLTVGIIAQMADSYGRKPAILVGIVASIAFPLSVAIIPFGSVCIGSLCTDGFWFLPRGRFVIKIAPKNSDKLMDL